MKTALKGNEVNLSGNFVEKGAQAPEFCMRKTDLSNYNLADNTGKYLLMNIFPSVDTPVCSASVRRFNVAAANMKDTEVLCISKDLPFAQGRFCGAEGIENVIMLSDFATSFGHDYGVLIADGPMKGLLARCIIILSPDHKVIYTQLVPEITQEPNYEDALNVLRNK